MKSIQVALGLVAVMLLASPSYAADEAKCQELFTQADTDHDGNIGGEEINGSKAMLTEAGIADPEEGMIITKAQFIESCMKK